MTSSTCSSAAAAFILFFSLIILFIATLCFGGCIERERIALLQFKNGLSDPSHRLSDWVSDDGSSSDCCRWTGVVCHNVSFHVVELHLRTLSQEEYFGPDRYYLPVYDYGDSEYEEYYNKTAFGGKVSSSLLKLKHLSYLDLSNNDFGGVSIPKFIGSLQSLRYLNLFQAGFGGMIPPQLGNLSNLQYLNIQGYWYNNVENLDWVSSLSSLEFLDMSYVNLSQSFDCMKVMNSLPSLLELHLSQCSLPNQLLPNNLNMSSSLLVLDLSRNNFGGPNGLQNMTSPFLRELDLSFNFFNSSIPDWLYDLTNLQLLSLRSNHLQGQISSVGIGNLTSLVTLDLLGNEDLEFEKRIPSPFRNFCNLKSLYLSGIKLNQEVNEVLAIMSSGCVSSVLQSLDLRDCQLSGHLTDDLSYFKNLISFDISDNSISGPIPLSFGNLRKLEKVDISNNKLEGEVSHLYFENLTRLTLFDISYNSISGPIPLSLGEMNSLEYVNLRYNRLNGFLPVSFGNLRKLEKVDISDNKLEGEVSHIHFANLTRLTHFYASNNNNISLRVSSNWIPPLQLQFLDLGSWRIIGSQFPKWLRLLKHLTYLDLSNYGISTPVPLWFWDSLSNYYYLNFSHNQMHGSVPDIPFVSGTILDLPLIHLNSNNFSGTMPYFSSNVTALDLSNNSFSGSIFHFLCNNKKEEKQMQVLNLESNVLHGEIPDCWSSWNNLEVLKLSNNKFNGNIPNSIGTLGLLVSINLRNNNLSGEMPSSIQNCMGLVILDISENNLVGNVSTWIGDGFSDLSILSLHANKFDGYLPKELCCLVSLCILDLAHNSFSGMIPSCFSNFTRMASRDDSSGPIYPSDYIAFMESALLAMKGKVMEYSTILGLVRSIDLSDNNLSGEIPEELTILVELLSLNLSHNSLTGRIPNDIGNMKGLDVIDFSHNQLTGEIPQSMSALPRLGTLDLSYNNLFGRIPSGTQLQGFNSSSFMDNQLCGLPLTVNCTEDGTQPDNGKQPEGDEDEMDDWFYISMAYGFGVGFWIAMSSLIFIRRWRHFYFGFMHSLWEKIRWSCYCRYF